MTDLNHEERPADDSPDAAAGGATEETSATPATSESATPEEAVESGGDGAEAVETEAPAAKRLLSGRAAAG